ncbi:MAG: hypothetical protein K5634_05675 [Sphaerochaetaceae bacterium]|nr:hypothetical protein [Sphaerochaetaceae bacterium]
MTLEDLSKELDREDPELTKNAVRKTAGDTEVKMSNFSGNDIPETEDHHIVSSTMDDWEQPNQVVCCEVE